MSFDYVLYFLTLIGGGYFAFWVSAKKMNTSFVLLNYYAYIFFCLIVSLSMGLFGLFVQEIVFFRGRHDSTQEKLWNFQIRILNLFVLFVGPLLITFKLLERVKYGRVKVYLLAGSLTVYGYFLFSALLAEAQSMTTVKEGSGLLSFLSKIFSKEVQFNFLVKAGGILISCMTGFSAVNVPFDNFSSPDKKEIEAQVERIKDSFRVSFEQIREKKLEISALRRTKQAPVEKVGFFSSFFSKSKRFGDEIYQAEMALKIPKSIYKANYGEYIELRKDINILEYRENHPILAAFNKYLSVALVIVSLHRVVNILITWLFNRSLQKSDPILRLISLLFWIFRLEVPQDQKELILNGVYFAFFGLLIVTNLRGFVLFFFKFLKFFFKSFFSKFLSSELLVLLSAQFIAMYFICSFYLLASRLPEPFSVNVHKIVDSLDFVSIYSCLDRYFFGSVLSFLAIVLVLNADKFKSPEKEKNF